MRVPKTVFLLEYYKNKTEQCNNIKTINDNVLEQAYQDNQTDRVHVMKKPDKQRIIILVCNRVFLMRFVVHS